MKTKILIPIAIGALLLNAAPAGAAALSAMAQRLSGRILLQVESRGEAYYVIPGTNNIQYMSNGADTLAVMRKYGVGITNKDLTKIQVGDLNLATTKDTDGDGLSDAVENTFGTKINSNDSDNDSYKDKQEITSGHSPLSKDTASIVDKAFSDKQKGKIFLQVESLGEAWYVSPTDSKRYYLGQPADGLNLLRKLGLGITNANLKTFTKLAPATGNTGTSTPSTSTPGTSTPVTVTDCGTALTSAANSCFNAKFASCAPAKIVISEITTVKAYFETIKPITGGCQMRLKYLAHDNSALLNKEAICTYDNTKTLAEADDAVGNDIAHKCTGTLADYLILHPASNN
jgi:hypothetical protein